MIENNTKLVIIVLFVFLGLVYFFLPLGLEQKQDTVFLSIATFLFSIFTGFFIARQGRRYSSIRKEVSDFDGNLSFVYRSSGHLGSLQKGISDVLVSHYQKIIETKRWDHHFTHKSTTITDIHKLLEVNIGESKLESLKNNAIGRIFASLLNLQVIRKNMVALHQERIPFFQWFLIYIFVLILIATVSTIPSHEVLLAAILKSAFSVSVISVLIILYKLDNLSFFEGTIGEHSAQDVLDIIKGKK